MGFFNEGAEIRYFSCPEFTVFCFSSYNAASSVKVSEMFLDMTALLGLWSE